MKKFSLSWYPINPLLPKSLNLLFDTWGKARFLRMGYLGKKVKIKSEGGENINIGHELENQRELFKERTAERSIVLFDDFQERINELNKESMK